MRTSFVLLLTVVTCLAACGGSSSSIEKDTNVSEDLATPEVEETSVPADLTVQEVDMFVAPLPDLLEETTVELEVVDIPDVPEPEDILLDEKEEDLAPEDLGPVDTGVPPFIPEMLPVRWTNLEHMDMVTIKKQIVIEFEKETRMPENAAEEVWYNKIFAVEVNLWDKEAMVPGEAVPVEMIWRPIKEGQHRYPALIIKPAECCYPPLCDAGQPECSEMVMPNQWIATQAYRLSAFLGDQYVDKVFHTLPMWTPGYKVVTFDVPVPTDCDTDCGGDCTKCFPFPVHIHVFIPPEYEHDDPACCENNICPNENQCLSNTSQPWANKNQRYPALVGLHGYNGQGGSMYDAYGWKTLPRFSSQGVVEPTLVIMVDGTVPSQYCGGGWHWPGTSGNTCYTQFMGVGGDIPNDTSFVSYAWFLANTLKKFMGSKFRIRGQSDNGDIVALDTMRRSWGVTGLSGGGWGALVNAFLHPEAYGVVYGLMPTTVSFFNPFAYFYQNDELPVTYAQVCNKANNPDYPFEIVGDGYRDNSMIDPETGQTRDITMDMREIKPGAKSCFWWSPPPVSNAIVQGLLCGMDITCGVDPDAPDLWRVDFDEYPFDGNILFTTGIRDFEGPPAAFFDLDQQLDKRGVVHGFRYEDQGGVYHDWQAIYDQVVGRYEITWQDGTVSPGNYPGKGLLYPYVNNAFEGLGNYPFNHPFASEFTTGALDPDRDQVIDLIYEPDPSLNYVDDNCPGVYNPDQKDSDGDGVGDACQ